MNYTIGLPVHVTKGIFRLVRGTRQFYSMARLVSNIGKKNTVRQAMDVFRLRYGKMKLSGREYYSYGLYDDTVFPAAAKQEFISRRRAAKLYKSLNQTGWRAVATDKVLFYSILQGLGLPFPKLYAVYHYARRYCGSIPFIREPQELSLYLRREMPFPCFSKPVSGAHGIGAIGVVGIDRARDQLILGSGEQIDIETFVHTLVSSKGGQLFQEYVSPHLALSDSCSHCLTSIRMMTLLSDDGPTLIRAIWKIPTGRNMTDNFNYGTSGNLLGQIDVTNGRVERVIKGVGPEQVEVSLHPETGKPIKGLFLPDWRDVVNLCLSAASALPGLRFQHWDIALSRNGPVILEVNACGDLDLAQLAYRTGLFDVQFRTYLSTRLR